MTRKMDAKEKERIVGLCNKIAADIKPHLAGHPADVQGVVLADLLSIWLAGHAPVARKALLAAHIENVRSLIPINELILFGEEGHPQAWMTEQ